jgi:Alpha/beta hydrolase domain
VQAGEQSSYKTRIVVNRPSDPANFNGTVIVEWLNVSAGFDSAPDWGMLHTELIRQGYAWVGVTAQQAGVKSLLDGSAAALLGGGGAERYVGLSHPGDSYSYDIYSQIAQAIREPDSVAPLGELKAQRLIGAGESQSAHHLMTYVNAMAPLHALYDGYFIHSRIAGSASLMGGLKQNAGSIPNVVRVRTDLGSPVMMLQTESDLFVLGSYPSRQDDSTNFRLWEVAGTAHADLYTFIDNRFDLGNNPKIAAVIENSTPVPGIIECTKPVNAGPQHFVAKAAMRALNTWLVDGTAPIKTDRLEVAGEPAAFVLDELGNVKGGIRTPYVDTPIAILSGEGQPTLQFNPDDEINVGNTNFCFLSGITQLFDAATLGSLYADNAAYIDAVNRSTNDAVSKGYLIPEDGDLIKAYAAGSDIFSPL